MGRNGSEKRKWWRSWWWERTERAMDGILWDREYAVDERSMSGKSFLSSILDSHMRSMASQILFHKSVPRTPSEMSVLAS